MKSFIPPENSFEQFLKLPAVIEMTGKDRSSLYAEIKVGRFPAQIKIGKRAVAWSLTSIQAWLRDKIVSSSK